MTNPETPSTAPVAWCRSDEFAQFAQGREYLLAFSEQHPACDIPLYAQPQTSTAQPTGPSLEEVGTLMAWLGEKAIQAADAGLSKDAGMLTWASQVIGERVDEDALDADQAEGPSLADVDELCAKFGFHLGDDRGEGLGNLRDLITAAIARCRAPVAEPVAAQDTEVDWESMTARMDFGMAKPSKPAPVNLAHPAFTLCHDGPAALPAPDHVNLIGFAFGREPWATWLRQGGCLESAHCELSDLMLAVLAKWGHPAALPAPGLEIGEVEA